ncbi:MAG: carbon monoxide dehydrogenase subunit G [Proteobacteria bacterium]|nr:carbon monoxide dehydrogenase subunit G [Pseudomonadota bacterium]
MDMTGEYRIAAPREVVWRGLNDPAMLQRCIPGCETVEKISDNELTARVVLQVGPVRAKFNGKVTLSDLDPPNGYRITGEGQGGVAGFGKGGATVTLAQDGADTVLRYTAQATVGGKLAQIGARLIDATAKKLADEFFSSFAEAVAAPAATARGCNSAAGSGTVPAPPAPRPTPTRTARPSSPAPASCCGRSPPAPPPGRRWSPPPAAKRTHPIGG